MFEFIKRLIKKIEMFCFEITHYKMFKDDYIYIVMCNSIGDMITALGCIPAFQKKKTNKRICVICDERKKEIVELYSDRINKKMYLNEKKLQKYLRTSLLAHRYKNKLYLVKPWLYFNNGFEFIRCYPGVNFVNFIKYSILNLNKDDRLYFPDCSNFKYDSDYYLVNRSNTVVLCPYAKSIELIPVLFWTRLAKKLNKMNFSVYTNVAREKEEVIDGTQKLDCSMKELIAIANDSMCVVGIRSGILDWLLLSNAPILALYPNEKMMNFYDFGDLSFIRTIDQFSIDQNNNDSVDIITSKILAIKEEQQNGE